MKEIKKVDVMSFAIMYGLSLALLGLIFGLMFASISNLFMPVEKDGFGLPGNFGTFSIIVFPLLYGTIGFVFGLLAAVIYNLFAGWVGGIKLELKDVQ